MTSGEFTSAVFVCFFFAIILYGLKLESEAKDCKKNGCSDGQFCNLDKKCVPRVGYGKQCGDNKLCVKSCMCDGDSNTCVKLGGQECGADVECNSGKCENGICKKKAKQSKEAFGNFLFKCPNI